MSPHTSSRRRRNTRPEIIAVHPLLSQKTKKKQKQKTRKKRRRALTDLPDCVIDEILCRLPITDAVRTCVLSRSWRHRWQSIPDLDLSTIKKTLIAFQILHQHSGSIRLLKAAAPKGDDDSPLIIDCWLASISRRRGGDSTLRTLHLKGYNCHLDSIARYFPRLTYLWLSRGSHCLTHQDYFSGFKALRTLRLSKIPFDADLSMLFAACPLLETTVLIDIDLEESQELEIVAPNLRVLELQDVHDIDEFAITCAPVLEVVSLNSFVYNEDPQPGGTSGDCKVIEALGGMPNVKKLDMCCRTFEYLSDGKILTTAMLPITFDHLKFMSVGINFGSVPHALLALCFLRGCPNLQELECRGYVYEEEVVGVGQEFWEAQDHQGVFDKLETVNMSKIEGVKAELDFIQFVLAKAESLKTMMVDFEMVDNDHVEFMSELLQFPVISDQAQIVFKYEMPHSDIIEV